MTRLLSLLALAAFLASAPLAAQDTPAEGSDAAEVAAEAPYGAYDSDRLSQEGFRPAVGGGDEDTIPGGRLMLAAYVIFFTLIGLYVVRLTRRHSAVQSELAALRRQMEDIDDRLDDLDGGAA